MDEFGPGVAVTVDGHTVEVKTVITGSPDHGAFHVTTDDGDPALLWTGDAEWLANVRRILDPEPDGLPRVIAVEEDTETCGVLLTAPPHTTDAFTDESWRATAEDRAILALQNLASVLGALHENDGWLHGLKRSELYLDLVDGSLHIAAMPRLRIDRKPSVEAPWRDMRLIGELAYENFMDDDYPGGHQMAAMLQDRSAIAELGILFPGLPQLLAGCVSPYGDLAYVDTADLWDGLEQIRYELEQPLSYRVGAGSTVGNYIFRKNNQDSCGHIAVQAICGSRKVSLGFFCVADGIGGIQDGEKASRLAVETACEAFARGWAHYGVEEMSRRPVDFARSIAKVVGQRLALEGEFEPENNRGGTTFSGLLIVDGRAAVCHVGDSRVHLVRDDDHVPLTHDHTLANILIKLGELTESEAEDHDLSQRTISRFLSTATEVELGRVDGFGPAPIEAFGAEIADHGMDVHRGDLYLLTSDGAHGEVSLEELNTLLDEHSEQPQALADALIANALERIGRDNATVLVVLVE